jgi:hypothetical protein
MPLGSGRPSSRDIKRQSTYHVRMSSNTIIMLMFDIKWQTVKASRGRRSLQSRERIALGHLFDASTPSNSRGIGPRASMDIRTPFLPTRRKGRYTLNPWMSTIWSHKQILLRNVRQSTIRPRRWLRSRRRIPSGGFNGYSHHGRSSVGWRLDSLD